MKIYREQHSAEYSQVNRVTTVTFTLQGEFPCDEPTLDNCLQFVMLRLGIDKRYMEPYTDEAPEPVAVEPPKTLE